MIVFQPAQHDLRAYPSALEPRPIGLYRASIVTVEHGLSGKVCYQKNIDFSLISVNFENKFLISYVFSFKMSHNKFNRSYPDPD